MIEAPFDTGQKNISTEIHQLGRYGVKEMTPNQADSSATSEINTVVVENGDTITNSSETVEGQVSVDSVVNASI